jgi:hypothetical protein
MFHTPKRSSILYEATILAIEAFAFWHLLNFLVHRL